MLAQISAAADASSIEQVVLATGRRLVDTLFIAEALDTPKLRYLLVETGAVAYDLIQDAPIDLAGYAKESAQPELAAPFADLSDVQRLIAWYNSEGQQLLEETIGCSVHQIPKQSLLTLVVPESLSGSSLTDHVKQLLRARTSIEASGLNFYFNEFHVDITSQIDKGTGAAILLDMLGFQPVQASMVGDGSNDLSAFEMCGHGFCPSNAVDALKAACRALGGAVLEASYGAASLEVFRRLREE
jgi:hydroxymethylpyrimidine pyrophosphatase-like HAD family hydrolase